jgi:hypothetical protein
MQKLGSCQYVQPPCTSTAGIGKHKDNTETTYTDKIVFELNEILAKTQTIDSFWSHGGDSLHAVSCLKSALLEREAKITDINRVLCNLDNKNKELSTQENVRLALDYSCICANKCAYCCMILYPYISDITSFHTFC